MTTAAPAATHPVTLYAQSVVAGAVIAGRFVRLACERHLRDLENGGERGLWFEEAAANDAIAFFGFLHLAEGEHAGKPFTLQPWQIFIVGCLFGWKGNDGYRRFRDAYIEIAKGNGKTPLAAGIGLYMLVADGEASAEVYAAAVTREQASTCFRDAKLMGESSPALVRRLDIKEHNISFHQTNSFFRAVSSEHRALDSKRVHCAIIDEIHEHPTSLVVDKMGAGTKGRTQALIIEITNSGYDRQSVCYQHHELSVRILEGVIENDSWFAFVCGLDSCEKCYAEGHTMPQEGCADCDDWTDEAVWQKPNPNLGVSVTLKYLRQQVAAALGMPAKANIVKRLNFCVWTESVTRWIGADVWEKGAKPPPEPLAGKACFAGLAAPSTQGLAALQLYFPDEQGGGDVLSFFWLPEDNVQEMAEAFDVPVSQWVADGDLDATEGNVVDYEAIREKLLGLRDLYEIREVGVLANNTTALTTQLMGDGFDIVSFHQSYAGMSAAAKELELLLKGESLRHGGQPVLRWQVSNTVAQHGPGQAIMPSIAKSPGPIVGVLGLVMALDRASRHEGDEENLMESRGFITL
jgi:phage terminase large subunit-like protein